MSEPIDPLDQAESPTCPHCGSPKVSNFNGHPLFGCGTYLKHDHRGVGCYEREIARLKERLNYFKRLAHALTYGRKPNNLAS